MDLTRDSDAGTVAGASTDEFQGVSSSSITEGGMDSTDNSFVASVAPVQTLQSAPNVKNAGASLSPSKFTNMSAKLELPKAVAVKKKAKPVDDWDVEKDLKDTHPDALFRVNEKVLVTCPSFEGQREARILKFNTKSVKRQRVMLYRIRIRGMASRFDEWVEEPMVEKHSEEKASIIREAIAAKIAEQEAEEALKKAEKMARKERSSSKTRRTSSGETREKGEEGEMEGLDGDTQEAKEEGEDSSPMKRTTNRPYGDLVKIAISELKERTGSSQAAITKYIQRHFPVNENKVKKAVSVALKQGLKLGALVKVKGSYKLSKAAIKQMAISAKKVKEKIAKVKKVKAIKAIKAIKRRFPVDDKLLDSEPDLACGRPEIPIPDAKPTSFTMMGYSSSDLLMIWDFFHLYRHQISSNCPKFTLDEFQEALLEVGTNQDSALTTNFQKGGWNNPLIVSLFSTLLRALCGRRANGTPLVDLELVDQGEQKETVDYSLPAARLLWGHFVNALTWPEILRRYALSTEVTTSNSCVAVLQQIKDESQREAASLKVSSLLDGDSVLKAAVEKLGSSSGELDNISCVALLRFLVNESLALPEIATKITDDATRIQTARLEYRRAVFEERKALARKEGKPLMLGKRKSTGEEGEEDNVEEVELSPAEAAALLQHATTQYIKTENKHPVRREKLGEDRNDREYWFIPILKQLLVRTYVERDDNNKDTGHIKEEWGKLTSVLELEQLRDALDERGIREKALKASLIRLWQPISSVLEKKPAVVKKTVVAAPIIEGDVRRSSRIKIDTQEVEAAKAASTATIPTAAAASSASTTVYASTYRHMGEPWRLLSLRESGHSDDVSFSKQELITLGSKLTKYCPDLIQSYASTWRQDVKGAFSLRELIPSAMMLEDVLYQAEHPLDTIELEVAAGVASSLSDDEEDEEDDEEKVQGGGGGASGSRSLACSGMSSDDAFICKETLSFIRNRAQAVWFAEPVDPIALGIPQYFEIVKHPMDFGTIAVKLARGDYTGHEGFKEDMELVFENAVTFTPEEDAEVHKAALALRTAFNQKYGSLIAKMQKKKEEEQKAKEQKQESDSESEPEPEEEAEDNGSKMDLDKVDAVAPKSHPEMKTDNDGDLNDTLNTTVDMDDSMLDGADDDDDDDDDDAEDENDVEEDENEVEGGNDEEEGDDDDNNEEAGEDDEEENDDNNDEDEDENSDNEKDDAKMEDDEEEEEDNVDVDVAKVADIINDHLGEFETSYATEAKIFQGVASKNTLQREAWRTGISEATTSSSFALFLFALSDMARQLLPRIEEQVSAANSILSMKAPTPLIPVRIISEAASGASSVVWAKVNGSWWPGRLRIACDDKFSQALSDRGEVLVGLIGEPLVPYVVPLAETAPFLGSDSDPRMPRSGRPPRRALTKAIKVGKALRKHLEVVR